MPVTRYAVIGNPVAHSKSPAIHSRFAAQTGEEVEYSAIAIEEAGFDSFVRRFFTEGGGGLNITVPYKEKAFHLAENLTPRARRAGAVNTLYLDAEGRLCGDNTDGVGLLRDIMTNNDFPLAGKKVLLLGAGGAVRGVLAVLVDQKPASITVANRTLPRAEALRQEFAELYPVSVCGYEDLHQHYDLIINGTSLGLEGKMPPVADTVIGPGCCCYDMMYADNHTPFVEWALDHGAALALDGTGMLIEQAAESFYLWRGVRPETRDLVKNGF